MKFNSYTEFLNEAFDPSKFLTQEQIDWCNKHIDGSWGVNAKREVTVRRKNVEFKDKSFDRFPVKFAPVKGNFDCDDCPKLISLEGAPSHVGGNFWCSGCPELVSLKGAPAHVGGNFSCTRCPELTSLEGAPAHVGGNFDCSSCSNLVSLEGAPSQVGKKFNLMYRGCPKLPDSFTGIIDDYFKKEIDWKTAHKMIHSEPHRAARSLGIL